MFNSQQSKNFPRVFILLFVAICFSYNAQAVKKSAAANTPPPSEQISEERIVQKKPNFFKRVSSKFISKRMEKKMAKLQQSSAKGKDGLRKGMAIAALVLGILAFLTLTVGFIPAILAIIFGAIAKKRAKYEPETFGGKKMATAGLILGIVYLGLLVIILGGYLLLFALLFF